MPSDSTSLSECRSRKSVWRRYCLIKLKDEALTLPKPEGKKQSPPHRSAQRIGIFSAYALLVATSWYKIGGIRGGIYRSAS